MTDLAATGSVATASVTEASVEADGSTLAPPFFAPELTKRQKMTRRLVWLGIGLGAVLLLVVTAPLWRSSAVATDLLPPAAANVLPVVTFAVEHVESYVRERSYTGLLHESRRSQLSFQRGGEVLELLVDEGQVVTAGQTLGRLDARHIGANRARLEAQVAEAKAMLDELVAGPREETIAAKQAELRAQESQRLVLAAQLKRREKLVPAAISREEYETFLYDYQAAVAREDVVKRQLEEMQAGTRVEKISAQRARLAQLDAQLTDIAHDQRDTQLVAPFAGRVTHRFLDEGSVVSAGTPVLEVIDDQQLEAWVGLPPRAARALQVGDAVELSVAGQPIQATVQSLAADVQQTSRTRKVILRLNANDSAVLPGQVFRLVVNEQVAEPGYWVPTTALTRGTRGLWSLFVVQEGRVVRADVEILDTIGSKSFVRGTLQPGDQIVASGNHRIVVGQLVSVLKKEE